MRLNPAASIARGEPQTKEIMIPKIAVSGLGNYTRNVSEAVRESSQRR